MRTFAVPAVLVALCAPAAAKPVWRPPPPKVTDGAELAARLAEAIRSRRFANVQTLLRDRVEHDGVWFADAACAKQFGKRGVVEKAGLRTLARCLVKQKLVATTRRSSQTGGAIMTFEPGVEVELVFKGERLAWIGGVWPRDADRGAPTLTVQAFESLRTAGTTQLDDAIGKQLAAPASAWIKVCLDKTGKVSSTFVAESKPAAAGEAFTAHIADWKFRPFTRGRTAMPACAMTLLSFPASSAPATETVPAAPLPSSVADLETGDLIYDFTTVSIGSAPPPPPPPPPPPTSPQNVPPTLLEGNRISGTNQIEPDPPTKTAIARSGKDRVVGAFKMCLAPSGLVTSVAQLKSTGFADYDKKILTEIRTTWAYRPYLINGTPTPVCTAVTFIYRATP